MVALLVSLRWRQLGHQISKNVWYLVALVVSGVAALGLLTGLLFGLVALRVAFPALAVAVLVLVGSALTLGWWLGAIVAAADDALAPERFALLPVAARRLLPGLTIAGATTIGGIGTVLALLLMLVGWSVRPAALIAGLVMLPFALATCVLGARVVGGALAKWLARRRTRDLVLTAAVLLIACSGVLLNLVMSALTRVTELGAAVARVADALAWTPIGAVYGVPAAVAAGAYGVAALRALIVIAVLALLWWIAERQLAARLIAPIVTSGGGRVRSGGLVDRLMPATPAGAIAARSLKYRRRDPRHLINVVMLVLLPALMFGAFASNTVQTEGFDFSAGLTLLPAINALLVATILQMDIAYDNDAFALHIVAGVSGAADRAGRALAVLALAVPITLVMCVAACLLTGAWAQLPGSIGAAVGMTLIAAGAGLWVAPVLPGRAPPPGANPLGRGSSGGVQSMLAMLVLVPATLIAGGPALGFAIAGLWVPAMGWVALAAGLVVGAAALWAGIVLGGRLLEQRQTRVLAEVSSEG